MGLRPRIAITGPDRGGVPAWCFASALVAQCGGRPLRVSPARAQPGHLDGLIVGGGADVNPDHYGQSLQQRKRAAVPDVSDRLVAWPVVFLRRLLGLPAGATAMLDPARDELELRMVERARACGLPCLGICRGAQLLNVHAGGTLHQDLSTFYGEQPRLRTTWPRKGITVRAGSRLAGFLGTTSCAVNSLHDQAIRDVGQGLQIAAVDAANVVQAIEDPARPFWVGVQWHPEYLPQVESQRRLFKNLVWQAKRASRISGTPSDSFASDGSGRRDNASG